MEKQWSDTLKTEMALLSPTQQRAIGMIVSGEVDGVDMSRLLKTTYSCQWCGRVQGRSTDKKDSRKLLLALHESNCKSHGRPWRFAANYTTYYSKWGQAFKDCLKMARAEVIENALGEAARILQIGTPDAAMELRRQVNSEDAENIDRRASAVAILDRADMRTAIKANDPMVEWLSELKEAGEDAE